MSKIAVVSGSSSGIGEAIVNNLIKNDFVVYGISRSNHFSHPNFVWINFDLTNNNYSPVKEVIGDRKVDLLVNNAGVAFEKDGLDFDEESFRSMFDLNFKAPILLTKCLKDNLVNGWVINISSVSDRLTGKQYALYCSSKSALNIYFDVLSKENKEITFINLLPSYVNTPLLHKLQDEESVRWDKIIQPKDIALFIESLLQKSAIKSGIKIIIASNELIDDLNYVEDLWGYNVDTKEIFELKSGSHL